MNKLAIFVEGYTEVMFLEKLIAEIAGENTVRIEHREIRGGGRESGIRRTMALVRGAKPDTGQHYFVLIIDCGGDNLVKTRILEEHENLTRKDYSCIIGVRDVADVAHAEIPRLEAGLRRYIKSSLIPVHFILAVMEIEAWFLAEHNHFPLIQPAITVAAIQAALGFNPEKDDMQLRLDPGEDLKKCYALGGQTYEKHNARQTAEALSYEFIYLELVNKFPYLRQLVELIEGFLAA